MRHAVDDAGTGADSRGDAELTEAVRQGDVAAYRVLHRRHLGAARRAAGALTTTAAEREDLVVEAFARLLRVLRAGGGPRTEFRPHLVATMRDVLVGRRRRDAAASVTGPDGWPGTGPRVVVTGRLADEAVERLPERWQQVLWRTRVEGESPAAVAACLGMTANGMAALAYRARDGLRQAYRDRHVPAEARTGCRDMAGDLAGWVRGRFPAPEAHRIAAHVASCAGCREVADGLRRLNEELPGISGDA